MNCSLKSDRHKYTPHGCVHNPGFSFHLGLRPYLCLTIEKTFFMRGTPSSDFWRLCGQISSLPSVSEFPEATSFFVLIESSGIWSSSVATNLLVLTSSETKFIVGSDFATILSSPSCSCILFAIVSMQLVKLKFWEQQRKLKWLMLKKWRRLFHLWCVQLPLVRTVGVWCRHTWFEFLGPN